MHSQCPTCRTVFAVSEEQLDAHHGLVRCGKCRDIFNASWNLVDGAPQSADKVPPVESSPVADTSGLPPLPREVDARKAMLELLGDIDPETEAQLLAQTQHAPDTENEPLPPVTDYDDDGELQLEIEEPVRHSGRAAAGRDEGPSPQGDSLQLELPAGFSDYTDTDPRRAAITEEEEALDLKFEEEQEQPETRKFNEPRLELPPIPEHDTSDSDEEIIIEAPPALWGAFEDEDAKEAEPDSNKHTSLHEFEPLEPLEPDEAPATATQMRRAALKSGEPRRAPVRVASGDSVSELSRSSSTMADDVRLVEIPHPRRNKKMILWILGGVLLLILVLWQIKVFYFDDLAQAPSTRPLLVTVCGWLGCKVPARSAPKLIKLAGTQVNQHPEVPGALQVTVKLANRADFTQALPPLEVTLTDKAGEIVGRRTYSAGEYRTDKAVALDPKQTKSVFIDLAQPDPAAVGYEVQLVGR